MFENAFNDTFLELAFVEVSSNGIDFYRFRATSNTQTSVQIGTFDNIGNATQLNNLAGKYRGRYGTPFDLEELKDKPNLNVNAVTHVKIIDVVGSINSLYAMYDQNNNPVNDPFPTPFPSGGFDLDAVGVLYENNLFSNSNEQLVFPNPVQSNGLLKIQTNTVIQNVAFYQINGVLVFEHRQNLPILNLDISLLGYSKGVYVLYVQTELGYFTKKIIIL